MKAGWLIMIKYYLISTVPEQTEQPKTERSRNSSPSEFNPCIIVTALLILQNMMFDMAVHSP